VPLSPKAAGAETAVDVGVFCLGAAAGGLVDAALNSFGFAEPLVVASLAGSGALGLKKLLWDTRRSKRRNRDPYWTLKAEAALLDQTVPAQAAQLRSLIQQGEQARADPDTVRKVFEDWKSRQ
jgi:hypothetical protein